MISNLLLAAAFTLLLYLSWRLLREMKEFASFKPAGEHITDEEVRTILAKGKAANRTQLAWMATSLVTTLLSMIVLAKTGLWWPLLAVFLLPGLMISVLQFYRCRK
ncbi:MAG: hypothetical protein K2W82_14150 [Candidatus Obscuribacterales bacterium]|nr:hypothetical protein [Candidatus Obscuribacterales bacterium]